MIKRLLLSGALALAAGGVAHAQANNSNTWATPGNQTVGGAVQLCPRASDGLAVPCSSAAAGAGTAGAGFPPGATAVVASQSGTTTGFTTTLPGVAGKFTYLCGYSIQATATAAVALSGVGFTGLTSATAMMEAVAASPAIATHSLTFAPCLPASAVNTGIGFVAGAAGLGGVVGVVLWGYQL